MDRSGNRTALPRCYTVQEVKELVELIRHDPDLSPDRFAGMLELVQLLAHYENMTDEEIEAEVRSVYRNANR